MAIQRRSYARDLIRGEAPEPRNALIDLLSSGRVGQDGSDGSQRAPLRGGGAGLGAMFESTMDAEPAPAQQGVAGFFGAEDYPMHPSGEPMGPPRPNLVEDPGAGMDPYSDLLSQLMDMAMSPEDMAARRAAISSGFDQQKQALREAGGLATGAIGDYFGFARSAAQEGRGAVGDVYGGAQEQVGSIYDQLGTSLRSIPEDVTEIATRIAGGGRDISQGQTQQSAVANRAASAVAPFMAAGETARASGQENLTRRSAAAQNYMTQLASAAPAEAAQRQSSVEAGIAQRAAQIEGAKQQALLEYASDAPGDTFNRMLDVLQMQLQFDKLGLAQEELDVRRQGLQGGGGMGGMDLSDVNALLNIQEKQDPYAVGGRRGANMAVSGDPEAQAVFGDILSQVEATMPTGPGAQDLSEQALLREALNALSGTYATETETVDPWFGAPREEPAGGASEVIDPEDYRMVEEALRIMYGG